MKIVRSNTKEFKTTLESIKSRGTEDTSTVEPIVRDILQNVKKDGDKALIKYTKEFDSVALKSLKVTDNEINAAFKKVSKKDLQIIETACERIERFHKNQVEQSWFVTEPNGIVLGQKVTPLEKAGLYVPGGKAAYPSTVLMCAVPAKVAGVKEIQMVTPPGKKGINPYVLTCAKVAGVDKIFKVGGAQAIGALAYGTKTINRVDKIVGPGNIFVATAKRLVFGLVDIDMFAGPSEILVINDGTGFANEIAADLLGQAEHDELASSILITTSSAMAKKVKAEVAKQVTTLKRKAIAKASIDSYGIIIIAKDIKEACDISNKLAPEHLELYVENSIKTMTYITNAGAIFMGKNTPEAVGDYFAGPNHTLPTGGTARFSSPLGAYDFLKRSSVISYSDDALREQASMIERFANIEGLEAHGKSVKIRTNKTKKK